MEPKGSLLSGQGATLPNASWEKGVLFVASHMQRIPSQHEEGKGVRTYGSGLWTGATHDFFSSVVECFSSGRTC